MDVRKHAIDPERWETGVWLDYQPVGDTPVKCLIAGWMNPGHARQVGILMLPHHAKRQGEEDGEHRVRITEAYRKAEVEAIAGTVLLGWKDMTEGDEALEFTKPNAERVLRTCPEFRDWVRIQSRVQANFRAAAEVAAGKS